MPVVFEMTVIKRIRWNTFVAAVIPGAARDYLNLFLNGNLQDAQSATFDEAIAGCSAVFHAATSLGKTSSNNGRKGYFSSIHIAATRCLLDCIARHGSTVKALVLTSSMAAVAPQPEPPVKDETHLVGVMQRHKSPEVIGMVLPRQLKSNK